MIICVHCIHWFKVKEHMMRMKETKIYSALQTGIHALWWRICHFWGVPGLKWNIHNESQLVKVGFIQIQEHHSGLDGRFQFLQNINQRPGNVLQGKLHLSHEYLSHVSVSDTLPCGSWVCPNFNDMPGTAATLLPISEPMSDILTEVLNIT